MTDPVDLPEINGEGDRGDAADPGDPGDPAETQRDHSAKRSDATTPKAGSTGAGTTPEPGSATKPTAAAKPGAPSEPASDATGDAGSDRSTEPEGSDAELDAGLAAVGVAPELPTHADPGPAAAAPTGRRGRVSHWDRAKPPRDWRYVVGMLGRTLIVIGLLMFGFVGYQLWGTGIATARAQNRLAGEFEELVVDTQTDTDTPAGTPPTDAPATDAPATDAPSTTAGTDAPDTTAPPASPGTTGPATSLAPVVQDIPPILPGRALAKLEIPRMGKEGEDALLVVPGVDLDSLQQGPGHYPDTPLPGQLGNAAIAGHRTTWGEPFSRIDELRPGDQIIVTMLTGDRFVYEVATTRIVSPSDYFVVQTSDPTVAELTLTSCHPRWSARQRIAVNAFLVPEESAAVGTPTYYDLEANDDGRDATDSGQDADQDPAVTAPDTTDTTDTTDNTDNTGGTEPADGSDDGAGTATGTGVPDGPDALTAGWFDDAAAWPQIALWGAVCAAIAALAYRISRRFKNYAIGWAVAIVPFAASLYFVYQNVNRLLPPGL